MVDDAGRARIRRRWDRPSALEAFGISGLPTDPRISGGLPNQAITGFNALGRQATNPQWQYPTVWNPKVNYSRLMGRHSVKTGYEFQRIETEVQDVNPLYGRDTYNGSFTRPAGAAASNIYNLADFMLGLRAQYALSNVLIANLRQHMHFLYMQDDWRISDRLTLNLGLRYEYATPHWERDNILTNYDPVARTHGCAPRMVRCRSARSSIPTATTSDRGSVSPGRSPNGRSRAAATGSATRTSIAPAAATSFRSTRPQSITAVVNQTLPNLANGTFRPTEQGYPVGLTDPSQFNPLLANITYMPRDYHSSRAQSWFLSLQRELGMGMMIDVAYVGNRADDLLLFANLNQATPNNAAGTLSLQQRRPIQEFADITYAFNGGKSRYHVAADQVRLATEPRPDDSELAHALGGQGQRRRIARRAQRQLPGASGLLQPGRRLRPVRATISRTTARRASCGRCRSDEGSGGRRTSHAGSICSWAAGRSRASAPSTRASR